MEGDGDFVVAWVRYDHDGFGVRHVRTAFQRLGRARRGEFQVNLDFHRRPEPAERIGLDDDGDSVVAWQDEIGPLEYDVRGRRFNSSGTPQGGEFQLSADPGIGDQLVPRVAADADGDFVVAWHGEGAGGENAIFVRRFKAGGGPQHLDTEVDVVDHIP